MLVSYPLARLFPKHNAYEQGIYRYALTFPNTAAVGTPLIISLFGTAGLFQYGLFTLFGIILTYSWGIAQLQPSHGKIPQRINLLKGLNANFIAMVTGMILGLLGAPKWMPTFVVDTVCDLSQCYIPIALLLIGFSIADYPIIQVFHNWKVYLYSLYRLLIVPVAFLAILFVIKAPLMVATMTALSFAGPCGMNVVVYPAAYKEDCSSGASMVLVSSLGSILTVPIVYMITQMMFG